ncbi:hypothetical protein [Sediminicoccus sp. KRV36]|uniref:hypothetical protein n=1 Tax=Sediminicoccus sp. KRV36 TaxID=3133721 RepID=UPI00200D9461|nr:hypothetical protein [Sediminicoccus rosea]UPY35511.1 hypothetical protein LHU95_14930 [Sediminicoccus rosea]
MDFGATAMQILKWPWRWISAVAALPRMRQEIDELKRAGGDPMRCTACGQRLKVTAIRDMEGVYGGVMGEYVTLRCDTPGCAFTPRERDIRFQEFRADHRG